MRLGQWQRDQALRQTDLAERLDISPAYTSLLLSGKKTPSGDLAARIERETGGAVPAASWWPVADRRAS
jgi:transcriptional regulator with XRE-family HTH domain